jgi:hypothetical protein
MDNWERAALDRYITRDDDSAEEEELTPGEAAEARDNAAEADRLAFAWALHEQAERGEYTRAQWHAERAVLDAARAYIADAARFGPGDFKSAIALREAVEALDGKEETAEGRHGASCTCGACLDHDERAFTVWHDSEPSS